MRRGYLAGLAALAVIILFVVLRSGAVGAQPGSITGTVINTSTGAAVAGAQLNLINGATTVKATSDANGKFAFHDLTPGSWVLRVTALQYEPSVSGAIALADGQTIDLTVALQPVSSTNITSLGTIQVRGQRTLNTSSAAAVTINATDYVNSGALQVQTLLDSQPGITIEHFDNGAPGNVATFTIRGTGGFVGGSNTGYEILVLQDGEPLRNGQFGDADVSALTPAIYQRVEVVKGVGGTSLFGANTIGGTVNLVTIDPKRTEGGEAMLSEGGFGTSDYNLSETDTFGRFGYVFDIHRYGTDGFIPQMAVDVPPTTFIVNPPLPVAPAQFPTLIFNLKSGLAKFRYDLSSSTYAVLTGSAESDWRDQFGLLGNPTTVFCICTGQFLNFAKDPNGLPYFFGFPDNFVWNTSPKYSFDLHTTIFGGALVMRYYDNWINRWVDGNQGITCCFLQKSIDHLTGEAYIWEKAMGDHDITLGLGGNGDTFQFGSRGSGSPVAANDISVTVGTQIERTALVRDDWQTSPRLKTTVALYYSDYNDLNVRRFDPRVAFVDRPDEDSVVRLSVGSGFAAPRLSDIVTPISFSDFNSASGPNCPPAETFCNATSGNPNIQAETAVGYDLGYERTWGSQGDVSIDLYRTDLHNHIFTAILPAPSPQPTFTPSGTPVLGVEQPINLARSVYTGFELSAAIPVTDVFTVKGYYNTQAAYPEGVDMLTEELIGNVVNNQQYQGVPVHKAGWSVNFLNRKRFNTFFGADWYGPNNSYNVPQFWIYNAGLNTPFGDNMLHINWRNIFNANAPIFSSFNGGVFYPSVPGFCSGSFGPTGAPIPCGVFPTSAFSAHPHILTVTLDHRWGSLK